MFKIKNDQSCYTLKKRKKKQISKTMYNISKIIRNDTLVPKYKHSVY